MFLLLKEVTGSFLGFRLNSAAKLYRFLPVTDWMSWETIPDRILTSLLQLLAKFWKKETYLQRIFFFTDEREPAR